MLRLLAGLLGTTLLLCGCAATGDPAKTAAAPAQEVETSEFGELPDGEFVLGTGDKLDIIVYRHDGLRRSVTVDRSGKIMFPLVGDIPAAGRSVFALRDELTRKLARYLVRPEVSLEVTEVQSRRAMVLGKVGSPGYFTLETEVTALSLLAMAGGATDEANLSKVALVRMVGDKRVELSLDLKTALAGKDYAANVPIRSGDIMFVPSTRISNVSRYASYLGSIIAPVVALEGGVVLWPLVKDALKGKSQSSGVSIPTGQ